MNVVENLSQPLTDGCTLFHMDTKTLIHTYTSVHEEETSPEKVFPASCTKKLQVICM